MQATGWFKDVPLDVLSAVWKDDKESWSELPFVDDHAAKAVIEISAGPNPAASKLDSKTLYDNSYLQELVSNGFVKTMYPNYKG